MAETPKGEGSAADKPGMFDGADTVVLYEELAFQDVLPVLWRASAGPFDADTAAGLAERNVQVLQAWDAMEEHGPVEKPDEKNPYAVDLMRLERKMNLLLDLVGQTLPAALTPFAALAVATLLPVCPHGDRRLILGGIALAALGALLSVFALYA